MSNLQNITNTNIEIEHKKTLKFNVKNEEEKKKVQFVEGTEDNEFKNMKTSKKCCIYHKKKTKVFPDDE